LENLLSSLPPSPLKPNIDPLFLFNYVAFQASTQKNFEGFALVDNEVNATSAKVKIAFLKTFPDFSASDPAKEMLENSAQKLGSCMKFCGLYDSTTISVADKLSLEEEDSYLELQESSDDESRLFWRFPKVEDLSCCIGTESSEKLDQSTEKHLLTLIFSKITEQFPSAQIKLETQEEKRA